MLTDLLAAIESLDWDDLLLMERAVAHHKARLRDGRETPVADWYECHGGESG